LTGYLATIPGVTDQVLQICEFNIRINDLDPVLSDLDSQFIQHTIASNMLEIQSLQYALERAQNEELRGLLLMMLMMHTHDMEMALKVAERYNLNTVPDLTNVLVYPGTPNYDLGMRNVDLMAQFLNPLMNAGAPFPTVTATPTATMTGLPTDTPTLVLTDTLTATVDLTSTATAIPTFDTATSTASPTETMTATFTDVPTDTPTLIPSFTMTPSVTSTVDLTGTATETPTLDTTPTITPTVPAVPANFDMVSLHIIEEEHVMQVETALAAQRLVQNDEIRAFAKHSADVAQLHLLLMSDLKHRLFDFYTPPTPDFERDYQAPRLFLPDGN
jgi:predicted outer membrane protein